jgi:hypothetical protein
LVLLKGTLIRAAIDNEILPGNEPGMFRAKEGAGLTKLLRLANSPGGNCRCSLRSLRLGRCAVLLGSEREAATKPICVERTGKDVVDRDVGGRDGASNACKKKPSDRRALQRKDQGREWAHIQTLM